MNCLENLNYLNIVTSKKIYRNLPVSDLVSFALKRGEGTLSETGALVVKTGKYTGRSPKDRFIVSQDSVNELINWGKVNLPIEEKIFDKLYNEVCTYLGDKDLFVFDGYVGAMEEYRLPIRVVNEFASEALLSNQLFRRPDKTMLDNHKAQFTVIAAPGFKARGADDGINSEAFIIINFDKKIVLIGGT